jgi:hypothetical protein
MKLNYDFKTWKNKANVTFVMVRVIVITTTFFKSAFSKSIIFKVKNTFEPNVFKLNNNNKIISVKILSNFKKEWCTFGRKKRTFEKKKLSIL